jgi:O-antigen/teichoic acid export membrane protein
MMDGADHGKTRNRETKAMATASIVARVINAGLVFLTQILFARVMGVGEFGIYATANTWMLLVSGVATLGLVAMPQRFLPEYELAKDDARIRGLIRFATWGPIMIGTLFMLSGVAVIMMARPVISAPVALTTSVALLVVPALVSINVMEGIALTKAWKGLAYGINFIVRPLVAPLVFLGAWYAGVTANSVLAMAALAVGAWCAALLLLYLIWNRYRPLLASGPTVQERNRWLKAGLPVMLIDGAFMLMTSTDVIILSLYHAEAEVGTYSAAARLVALVAFVHYGLTWASGHHFSALHAAGKRDELARYSARTSNWTFLPSVVAATVIALAAPSLLLLFGKEFGGGGLITSVLLLGLLARASVGPAEQLLVMTDNQMRCAYAYAWAFGANIVLCLLLVPAYGGIGAAASTALSYLTASLLVEREVRHKLGFPVHVLTLALRPRAKVAHA